MLRAVGRRIADGRAVPTGGLCRRLEVVVTVLGELGGLAEVEEHDSAFVVRSHSCPLTAVVVGHPEVYAG
ncbi:MAG: hypothetical protein JOZ19_00345 [Rubrobacter sp.]|nr:hypothetical protein [Rubrobacter sp.]